MAKKEANFDLYIHDLLVEAGIHADTQGSNIIEINNALKSASKHKTGNVGFPEYCAVVNDFVLVMEDKSDRGNLCAFEDDGTTISLTMQATTNYAVNGALHYAKHILQNTTYNKVFAFGNAGDRKHHIIQPLFVDNNGYTWLPEVETFENFSANHILEYYKRIVLKETPPEDIELADILKKAKELHEYLRNYGGLGEDEKPLVVSAILLALREQKYNFRLDMLKGDSLESNTDGAILYQYLEMNLQRAKVSPEVKKARVLNQFTLIKDRPQLNTKRDDLGNKTPLRFFAEYINENIFKALTSNSKEDYLGRFYGEFVSYSGGDGQSNLICEDFLAQDPWELQLSGGGITVGFMNPPYSQAKNKDTANLSELCFIRHLLNSITEGGRAAVIVPVSAMIGKTKEDKAIKKEILKNHTLEGVISLNKDTFYRVGTVPCIAVFTTGIPHSAEKKSKFINFEDDGYEVKKHLGLVETERAKDKRQYLLDCWHGKIKDFPSSFMVETTVEDTDEWLHSFYYYNDEIPTEEDFLNSIGDYLTFEFNMISHDKGYLFEQRGDDENA